MNQTTKIIIERICRVLISLIPYVGSPLEQLTFGIKESIENQELLKVLDNLEKTIRELEVKGLSTEDIINQLKISDDFIHAELLVTKEKSIKNENQLMLVNDNFNKVNTVAQKINQRLEANNETLNNLSKKIKNLENENGAFYNELNQLLKTIDDLKLQTEKNSRTIKISSNKIQVLKDEAKYLGKASKLAIKENIGVLLSSHNIWEYSQFPFNLKNESSLFREYVSLNQSTKFYIIENELSEIYILINHYKSKKFHVNSSNENSSFFALKKVNLILNKLKENFEENILKTDLLNNEIITNAFTELTENDKYQLVGLSEVETNRKLKRTYAIISKLCFINQLTDSDDIFFLYPLESNYEERIFESLCSSNFLNRRNISKVVFDIKLIALFLFLKTKHNLHLDISAFHQIFETLNSPMSTDGIVFKNDSDIKNFRTNLQILSNYIVEFKSSLKNSILNPLYNFKQQQIILNKSFLEFYSAYAEIENSIKKSLSQTIENLNFDEE